jgi:uncharacterized protein
MKTRLGFFAVVLLCGLAPPARAQLNLNPFAGYYNNIPRAAKANDVAKIRSLLDDGTSPNQTDEDGGTTGLHVAASSGNLQIIAILYKAGGNINERDPVGSTPLDLAAEHDQVEAVKLLLDMKANLNNQNKNGMTALMFAAKTGDVDLVQTFLSHGANANLSDYTGRDAAGWALESRRPMVVQMLKNAEHKH